MPDLAVLLVAGLATWRLSHILLYENGPFAAFRRAREALGVIYASDASGEVVSYRYELTVCILCLSIWVGSGVALLLWRWPWFVWLLLPFALSAVASVIGKLGA